MKFRSLAAVSPLLLLAACSSSAEEPADFTVKGELTLYQSMAGRSDGKFCEGEWDKGYGDIVYGMQLTIVDSSGDAVALGSLGEGRAADPWHYGTRECVFPFEISGVPDSGTIYGITMGDRGTVNFSIEEADNLQITIG